MNRIADKLIKILSLGIGLAIGIVLIAKVCFELSYDSFYKDVDRIYSIKLETLTDEQVGEFPRVSGAVAPGFKAEVPGVEEATRIVDQTWNKNNYTDEEGQVVFEGAAIMADSCFFKVFSIPILAGDIDKALVSKEHIAISRSFAENLGGVEACLGKTVGVEGDNDVYLVEAVFDDMPVNGTLLFDVVYSINWMSKKSLENWMGNERYTSFVKLQKGIDPHSLDEAIHKMQATHQDLEKMKADNLQIRYVLVPFDKLHSSDPDVHNTIVVLSIVAFLLLFISMMNYILVVLSSMVKRSKEIGIRKCYGAGAREIYAMLAKEAAIHIGLALVLAALLILAGNNLALNLLGTSFTTTLIGPSIRVIVAVVALIFVLSVIVPGVLYTRVPVWQAIRNFTFNMRHWKLFLLSLQVAVNVFIVAMLLVVTGQYEHMASEKTGYNYKDLYYINVRNTKINTQTLIFDKLRSLPEVQSVEGCMLMPYVGAEGNVSLQMPERTVLLYLADCFSTTEGYFDLLEIPFVMGHAPSDTAEIAISETFMEEMGKIEDWSDGPIGKQVYVSGHNTKQVGEDEWREEPLTVSGVYRNIRIGSALDPNMKPSCYFYGYNGNGKPKRFWNLLVKVNHANGNTMQKIQYAVNEVAKDEELEVKSYAAEVRALYADSRKMRNTILVGALFALLISLIGLVGYVSDEANRRSKEIALRKVHGAMSGEIVRMFVGEVLKLSLVAAVVGAVGAYFVARKWIEQFAFRINLSPLYFVGAVAIVLAIVALVIGVSSWRIARMNPVKSLKNN